MREGEGVAALQELLVSSPILNHNPSTCQSDILSPHARARAAATLETMGSYSSDDAEERLAKVWAPKFLPNILLNLFHIYLL